MSRQGVTISATIAAAAAAELSRRDAELGEATGALAALGRDLAGLEAQNTLLLQKLQLESRARQVSI